MYRNSKTKRLARDEQVFLRTNKRIRLFKLKKAINLVTLCSVCVKKKQRIRATVLSESRTHAKTKHALRFIG